MIPAPRPDRSPPRTASCHAVRDRLRGRVPPELRRLGRVSLAPLHPALAGHPTNRIAGPAVDQCLAIFLGQAARPDLKSLIGELSALGVGVLQRSTKLLTAAMIEFEIGRASC